MPPLRISHLPRVSSRVWGAPHQWLWVAAAIALAPCVRAELVWTKQRITVTPAAGVAEVPAMFEFHNAGTQPVRITGVQSDCGCTAATLGSDIVAAGATGYIAASFHAGDRQGRQKVGLTVSTEEPTPRSYALVLEVVLQEFATLAPQACAWRLGEEPTSRTFTLVLAAGFGVAGFETTNPDFKVERVSQQDSTVQLRVTPRDLWAKRSGTLKVRVVAAGRGPIELTASLRVQ